jgi:uncharacterized membrane protein YgcG
LQGSVGVPESYSIVSTGQQLIEQLANNSARYIKVVSDITLPSSLAQGAVSVERIVEVRACHPGGRYRIDWRRLSDAISVKGTAYFQGDMVMTGIGWSAEQLQSPNNQVVEALQPVGGSTVDYEVSSSSSGSGGSSSGGGSGSSSGGGSKAARAAAAAEQHWCSKDCCGASPAAAEQR